MSIALCLWKLVRTVAFPAKANSSLWKPAGVLSVWGGKKSWKEKVPSTCLFIAAEFHYMPQSHVGKVFRQCSHLHCNYPCKKSPLPLTLFLPLLQSLSKERRLVGGCRCFRLKRSRSPSASPHKWGKSRSNLHLCWGSPAKELIEGTERNVSIKWQCTPGKQKQPDLPFSSPSWSNTA